MDLRQRLHSIARGNLVVSTFTSDFGQLSFSVATPRAWNELPDWLCNIQMVDAFNTALKTFLFGLTYCLTLACRRLTWYCNGILCYSALEIVLVLLLLLQ